MKRTLTLLAALSLVMLLSGIALADGFGMCNYSSHVKQMASDQSKDSKTVANSQSLNTEKDKLLIAQTDKRNQATPTIKK